MAINLYDFHDIIRETYNEYVSRYEIDLVDFKNEYGTDSELKFIDYQRIYLGKMRDYIIENLGKINNEDLDSQFYHDKLQEALSENKKMFHFLNIRLNPMNYIPEQKEKTSKDEYLEFFDNLNNNKITESGMIKFIKSHETIKELETLIRDIDNFIENYNVGKAFNNWEGFQFDEAYKRPLSEEIFYTFKELVLSKIEELKHSKITSNNTSKKHYTENLWFEVGLKFATGEMFNLLKNSNPTQVAKKLGNNSYRPYIGSTIGTENVKGDKNIFNNLDKMENIIKYCEENKIDVCQDFIDKYNELLHKLK